MKKPPPPETPENLPFSFKKAVAEARRDFPKETATTIFADLSTPAGRQDLLSWIESIPQISKLPPPLREALVIPLEQSAFSSGFAVFGAPGTARRILIFSGKENAAACGFSSAFIFDHELGHIVVPGALNAPEHPVSLTMRSYAEMIQKANRQETLADTFAVLRGLRRGSLPLQDIADVAVFRGHDSWMRNGHTHLTMTAIDALLAQGDIKALAALSPREQVRFTVQHAEQHGLDSDDMYQLMNAFARVQLEGWIDEERQGSYGPPEKKHNPMTARIENMIDVAMHAAADSATFYIATRMLHSVAQKGYVEYHGKIENIASGIDWAGALEKVDARTPPSVKTQINRLPKPF